MESADDVRASLAVAPLGDLRLHEATSPDGESHVADLLGAARVLSWPLVVDAASGLILDGSHRAVVLARDFDATFAVVQRVDLDSPEVRIGTWCRVLDGVPAAAFDAARRALGLEADAEEGLRCHYGGHVYGRSRPEAFERARPLACLGGGLAVDRHYPERLWQFADHRIPDDLFADEAGRHAYADALARATLPDPARAGQRRQG